MMQPAVRIVAFPLSAAIAGDVTDARLVPTRTAAADAE
jgi:hypothetical protein